MTLRGGGPQRVLTLRDMYLTVDSVVKIGEKWSDLALKYEQICALRAHLVLKIFDLIYVSSNFLINHFSRPTTEKLDFGPLHNLY